MTQRQQEVQAQVAMATRVVTSAASQAEAAVTQPLDQDVVTDTHGIGKPSNYGKIRKWVKHVENFGSTVRGKTFCGVMAWASEGSLNEHGKDLTGAMAAENQLKMAYGSSDEVQLPVMRGDPVCDHCSRLFSREVGQTPADTPCGRRVHYDCVVAHTSQCEICQEEARNIPDIDGMAVDFDMVTSRKDQHDKVSGLSDSAVMNSWSSECRKKFRINCF